MSKYSSEFKARAIDLYKSGRSKVSIAKELGVTAETISNWVKAAGVDALVSDNLTYEQLLEDNRRLNKELARAREEAVILEKATAFFARKTMP